MDKLRVIYIQLICLCLSFSLFFSLCCTLCFEKYMNWWRRSCRPIAWFAWNPRVLLLWKLIKLSPQLNCIKNKIEKSDEIRNSTTEKFFGLLSLILALYWLIWCGAACQTLSHILTYLFSWIFTDGACLSHHTRLRLKKKKNAAHDGRRTKTRTKMSTTI